jgi:chlorobactene glucosyltransferase
VHFVSVVVLLLWLLALVRTIANLLLLPRISTDAQPSSEPLLSIVVPARNESHIIDDTVRAFLAQDYPHLELIVVNDRSTDGTSEILGRFADPRLTVIDGEEPPPGWLGKPWALEQGSRRARGELILFADADIIYAPPAVRAAVAELLNSDSALVALFPFLEMHSFGEQVGMSMLPFVFAMVPLWLANRWQRPGMAIGGGAGNLVRRASLEAVGYFTNLRQAVVDDIGLAQLVRRRGGRTLAVRAEDLVRVRMYHGTRAIAEGFTKNLFPAIGRSYVIATLLFALLIICHLLPYGLAVTGDRYAIASVILISATRVLIFRSMGYSMLNAIFFHPLMIGMWAYIFLRSVWITGVRKQVRWRGRVYDAAQTRFGAER